MSEFKSLADLKPDPNNARKHNSRNIGMITSSIGEVGVSRSGVIDEDGNILAGNGTYDALAQAGITKIKVVEADGEEWVVVQRKGLTPEQKAKLALLDNRTAELAEWDPEIIKKIDIEFPEITEKLWFPDELESILADITGDMGPMDGEDDAPEVPAEPTTRPGNLYQLGGHRLMCGDSTDKATVDILMDGQKADMVFTDPPYGVNYTGGKKKHEKLKNDNLETDIYGEIMPVYFSILKDDGAFYLWYADATATSTATATDKAGFKIVAQIIWAKNNAQFMTSAKYKGKHEPCFYGSKKGKSAKWFGQNNEVTLWEYDRACVNEYHPTQKPVALAERATKNSSPLKGIVVDLFGGSGSTLIACEKLKRKCYMMEIDPAYCDVIVKRWEDFTGNKAELIHQNNEILIDQA